MAEERLAVGQPLEWLAEGGVDAAAQATGAAALGFTHPQLHFLRAVAKERELFPIRRPRRRRDAGTGGNGDGAFLAVGDGVQRQLDATGSAVRAVVERVDAEAGEPLITLIGAIGGVSHFGLLGLLIGPLALSYFFELIRMYRQ